MPPAAFTTAMPPALPTAAAAKPVAAENGKLGLRLLVALVVGSVLGSGTFDLLARRQRAERGCPSR